MDESLQRHLEQQQQHQLGKLKLSEAIRIGAQRIREDKNWLNGNGCGCAIAMAAVAFGADPWEHQAFTETMELVERHTGLSRKFLDEVDRNHCSGISALSIADRLEAQGY